VFAVFSLFALVVRLSTTLGAAPQEPTSASPVSLDRIRAQLNTTSAARLLDMPLQLPVATFKTSVEQRVYVLTLEAQLRKAFTLTAFQRQSADWASKCCGLNLNQLFKSVKKGLQQREARKIHQQIARELARLEAARKE
jgi:hypothetical protein